MITVYNRLVNRSRHGQVRNLIHKFIYTILASLVLSFFWLATANAQCTWAKPDRTALEEYKDATVVLTGQIVEIEKSDRDKQDRYYETVKIAVDHVWKKNVDSIVTVKNYVYGCVQGWKKGDKFMVYAYLNDDKVTYSTGCCCSRTGILEKTNIDVAEFFNAGYARSNVSIPPGEKVIFAGWMNSRARNFRQPEYPSSIEKPRSKARVEVEITTDIEGKVILADVIRGPLGFHAAALEAARSLRFTPTTLSGVPTKVSGWASYDFRP